MMVKRIMGLPFSMTLNANLEWWGGAMGEKFADADFTDAIAEWLLDQIHREYPTLRPEQTILGRIGVDTRQWKPGENQRNGSTFRLITIGRLHASKGHDVLLCAVRLLRDRGADVTLRLCGAGGERENLERLANELGIADRAKFLGSLSEDQLIEQLKVSDAFALASHAEPLGVVYMEAMAMGVPTIGTAAGGVGEIITTGVDGILVEPNHPGQLADAIEELMKDEERRRSLGVAGGEKIVREFDSRVGAGQLYRRMFGKDPAPSVREPPSKLGGYTGILAANLFRGFCRRSRRLDLRFHLGLRSVPWKLRGPIARRFRLTRRRGEHLPWRSRRRGACWWSCV